MNWLEGGYRVCARLIFLVLALTTRAQQTASQTTVVFIDVTENLGIHWTHVSGATPEKYLIETMGGGAAFLDYNRDGRLDIFLVDSGCHKFSTNCKPSGNALYRQNADGAFSDVTQAAGLAGNPTYGMGVAVGDYDNDGFPDIYITGFPRNVLYHNNRDGTFTDVTQKAGVAGGGWSTSAAWLDYDHDGLPDLFVGRYMDWDYARNPYCGEHRQGYRSYCHPDQFPSISSRLYHNNGDGTFTDVTEKAGLAIAGKALGVVAFDFDRDGWIDLYVANDTVRNFLFRNNHNGTFTEVGLEAGVAYGSNGKVQSGMGVDAADVDGDGLPDLWVANIDYEPNNLFHNNGDGTFTDVTGDSRLGLMAILYSGFGTRIVDYDNDGKPDMFVLNGHPLDNIHLLHDAVTAAERPFLVENQAKGKFEEVGQQHGEIFSRHFTGRGLAMGDFDNDGDEDFVLVQNGRAPVLLRNDGGNRNAWIGFELEGKASGRDAIGALVTVTAAARIQVGERIGGSSYCSSSDSRLLFGLGKTEQVDKVEVRWPTGVVSTLEHVQARKYYRVEEPSSGKWPAPTPNHELPGSRTAREVKR
jgi:enediyne biosynthesis protein E4